MKNFLVIIEGPMGSGKSTIGALVHKKLKRTALLGIDRIKWFISDFKRGPVDNEINARVMRMMFEEYTKNGINVILAQGFWRKKYIEPYLKLAKKNKINVFVYQLEAVKADLLKRIEERGKNKEARTPVPKSRILNNLKVWEENRYELGKIFNTSKMSAEQVAREILREIKNS